ncbi:hypothetical protein GRJ2_000191600 [Grus japonensis]|uniref:Uncharacterized protein n=1 Tax=Grus japonensis TaxID=30415 RepID=A0ABC9VWY4_GRUJA
MHQSLEFEQTIGSSDISPLEQAESRSSNRQRLHERNDQQALSFTVSASFSDSVSLRHASQSCGLSMEYRGMALTTLPPATDFGQEKR